VLNAPDPEAQRLLQAAVEALKGGDRAAAKAHAQQLALHRPGDVTANQVLGIVALDSGDFVTARRCFEALIASSPNANAFNLLGVALQKLGDIAGARAAFTRSGELGLAEGWRNLAMGESGAAQIGAFERALALAPHDAAAHAGLAQALEARHDLARAKTHAAAAVRADAGNVTARLALARVLTREEDFAGAEAALAPVLQSPRTTAEQRILAFGLIGDARDRRDDSRGAFQAFTAANQISLQLHDAWLDATERLYHPQNVASMAACVAGIDVSGWTAPATVRSPVFLVGFPRSGTTLLDQIFSSHSGIICLEESEHFSDALSGVIADAERATRPDALSDDDLAQIRERYWRRVEAPADAVIVDKFPLNIVVLPLIKRVFPKAKIIFALRDPRDVVLSCYQQRFALNAAMAQFLELGRAGAYYDQVMTLFELCRARLGLDLHQVRYEDVVADLEGTVRAVCAFLGVAFEPAMLNYQKTALAREIATPSARQVIEPLYSRSVGRWRRYQEDLQPVLPLLAPWAKRFGYTP
jgi:tetratricopeptide (TPR) repeat protein